MDTSFSRTFNTGPGPSRLFIGGLHGKEGKTTFQAMQDFDGSVMDRGKLYLFNFPPSPYISTLERRFYDTVTGREVLELIKKIQPTIYLELHCYHEKNLSKLIYPGRKNQSGVPPLAELDKGVLIGSISPIIRSVFFKKNDFPFILEMQCHPPDESLQVYLEVLNIAAGSDNRSEILERLEMFYPDQVVELKRYFVEFSDNFFILFQKTRELVLNGDLRNSDELMDFMENLMQELDLKLNQIQLEQVRDAVLIFLEYKPYR
jgi:hypothetical protein